MEEKLSLFIRRAVHNSYFNMLQTTKPSEENIRQDMNPVNSSGKI